MGGSWSMQRKKPEQRHVARKAREVLGGTSFVWLQRGNGGGSGAQGCGQRSRLGQIGNSLV